MKAQKVVVKMGTSTLTRGTKTLSRKGMLDLVRQMALLHEEGHQIVLVSSGAIAAGREVLDHPSLSRTLPSKQMFAAVGQRKLMEVWAELFGLYEIPVGQLLLTREDFTDRQRYLNIRNTLAALLQHRVIPIINENDTVATEEIKVGDNDTLSALVSNMIYADLLILLTDQQGLYTADPRVCSDAQLIPLVERIDDSTRALAGGSSKVLGLGTGGMITKIEAAYLASHSGTPTVIASSSLPDVLADIIKGQPIGTRFLAQTTPKESRKRWLISKKVQGFLYVDEGASQRLSKKGASLLSVGITKVKQTFERGAIVQICSAKEKPLAIGIVNYSSAEIEKILGVKSIQIELHLGYTYGPEVIHRDNMVLLQT